MTAFSFAVNLTDKIKMGKSIKGLQEGQSTMEALIIERTNYVNLTQFLQVVGIPHKTWRRWITGETVAKPTIKQTKALCRELKMTIEELPDDFSKKHEFKN